MVVNTCVVSDVIRTNLTNENNIENCHIFHSYILKCNDYDGIIIRQISLNVFPGQMKQIFDKLILIYIEECELTTILQRDLMPFEHNLLELSLKGNKIESIDKGLFLSTKMIRFIDLSNNPIMSLNPEVFKPLSHLKYLNLKNGQDLDKGGSSIDYHEIQKLIQEIFESTTISFLMQNAPKQNVISVKPTLKLTTITNDRQTTQTSTSLTPNKKLLTKALSGSQQQTQNQNQPLKTSNSTVTFAIIITVSQILLIGFIITAVTIYIKKRKTRSNDSKSELNTKSSRVSSNYDSTLYSVTDIDFDKQVTLEMNVKPSCPQIKDFAPMTFEYSVPMNNEIRYSEISYEEIE